MHGTPVFPIISSRSSHPLTLFEVSALRPYRRLPDNNAIRWPHSGNNSLSAAGKEQTDTKFLVIAHYLDIYRLLNKRNVYINNPILQDSG